MKRGSKPREYNTCQDCGVKFKRWCTKRGDWTVAQYCPQCRNRRQGPSPNTILLMDVVRARRKNPCATLQEIGNRFGVTRERIRQILSQEGKPTAAYRQTYLCLQCGKDIGTRWGRLYCNKQCQYDYTHIKIACSRCGQLTERYAKEVIWYISHGQRSTDLFFCSKECQGKWLGNNYGRERDKDLRIKELV